MTIADSNTLPVKLVIYCPSTRDYEVSVDGAVIGFAKTPLAGMALANDHVYQLLERPHVDAADLSQDEAEAVLASQRLTPAALPLVEHPVYLLVAEAARLGAGW